MEHAEGHTTASSSPTPPRSRLACAARARERT
jgi:hypothetical protein